MVRLPIRYHCRLKWQTCGREAAHQGITGVLASNSQCQHLLLSFDQTVSVFQHIMSNISARWTRLASSDRLKRSSQTLSVVGDRAWIFGGELQPRVPIDNQLDVVELAKSRYRGGRYYTHYIEH